jgi:hypothetical protein
MKITMTRTKSRIGMLAKMRLSVDSKIILSVKHNECVTIDSPDTDYLIVSSHFFTKPCHIKLDEIYDHIKLEVQFVMEPFALRTPIQVTVSSDEKYIGIFKS